MSLAPSTSITAVASRSLDKATQFASSNSFPSIAKIYGSYEALLDDPDTDTIYLSLPTSLHLLWAVLDAHKKKHILLEKPVTLNVAEFDKIVKACEANDVQLIDGTMCMHYLRTAKMKEVISDSQTLGHLQVLPLLGAQPQFGFSFSGSSVVLLLHQCSSLSLPSIAHGQSHCEAARCVGWEVR